MDKQDELWRMLFGHAAPIIFGKGYSYMLEKTVPENVTVFLDRKRAITTRPPKDHYSDALDALLTSTELMMVRRKPQFELRVSEWISSKIERKQFRFPKSKKIRIRKKWSKDNCNYRSVEVDSVIIDKENFVIYGNKKVIEKIEKALENEPLRRRQFWKHFQNRINSALPGISIEPFGISSWSPMANHSV